ncbi:hypothetical protein [Thermomonospora echinospora]|uniref:hypothetical protein n=1 Tax=Thermomonospora echinospora TaxID=1992 RepID=UPI00135C9BB5|nr:hypothetical protein [Thermomonospora echinospora]
MPPAGSWRPPAVPAGPRVRLRALARRVRRWYGCREVSAGPRVWLRVLARRGGLA